MSPTQVFDRPTDVSVPGVLGFHDELYSGIRSTDVISVPSVLGFHDALYTGIRSLYYFIPFSPPGECCFCVGLRLSDLCLFRHGRNHLMCSSGFVGTYITLCVFFFSLYNVFSPWVSFYLLPLPLALAGGTAARSPPHGQSC